MNRHVTRGAAVAASAVLLLAGCSNNDSQDEGAGPQEPAAKPITDTAWFTERFTSAPVFVDAATTNPQTFRPDNNQGEPLPEDAPEGSILWQSPACVTVPFTSDGPDEAVLDTEGVLKLSGYEHTELGAAAAGLGLLSVSSASADQDLATSIATGLPLAEAQRLVATSPAFGPDAARVRAPGEPCRNIDHRPTAYRVADMTDSYAVVDVFSPVSNNPGEGVTIRLSVEWTGDDWRLSPSSFDSLADSYEQYDPKQKTTVDLTEFTQW